MLIGMIRPRGTQTAEVTGTSLDDVQQQLDALRPDGYELVNAPAEMIKGAPLIKTTGTFERPRRRPRDRSRRHARARG